MLALLIGTVWARNTGDVYHEVQVVDELGNKVTDITSVTILNPGSTVSSPTIYKDRNRQNTITQPMTSGSANTTLSNGRFSWYGPSNWDFSITDGTNIANNADHRDRTASEGTLVFPSYLTSISTTTYTDAQSATFGSTDTAQLRYIAGTAFRFTPSSDGVIFQVGVPSGNQFDTVFLVGGGTDGLTINEGASTLVWTGGTASLNNSGSGATNIGVGSTGAVSIGDGSSGAWSIDGTSTGTINADDSITVTVSAGTIDIDSTGGDLGIDATDKSVLIDAGEAAADDAIIIQVTGAASGMRIISLADIDITTTGAAGEDITITNTGGSIVVAATEAIADAIGFTSTGGFDVTTAATFDIDLTATGGKCLIVASEAAADQFKVDATGTVAGNAINFETTNGGIILNADGAANGDIEINAVDDVNIITGGDLTIATTGTLSIAGSVITQAQVATESVTANDTLTTAESGKTFIVLNDTDGISLTLPAVGSGDNGVWFTIVDANAVAASDVTMEPGTGDKISDGAANEGFSSDGADKIPCAATFTYHHATITWYVLIQELDTGTAAWAPDGS